MNNFQLDLRYSLLSVVIPIRNCLHDLPNLWEEVTVLLNGNAQVILVDDGSDDGSDLEIQRFISSNHFENLEVRHIQHSGPGAARNLGLALTSREWVTFWDADDIRNLSEVGNVLERAQGCDLLVTNFKVLYIGNGNLSHGSAPDAETLLDVAKNGGLWRMFIRRSFILDTKFPLTSMGEDLIFMARIIQKNPIVKFCKQITYVYSVGGRTSLTSQSKAKKDAYNSLASLLQFESIGDREARTFLSIILIKLTKTALLHNPFKMLQIFRLFAEGSPRKLLLNLAMLLTGLRAYCLGLSQNTYKPERL
jgi:glycosyltransferase involved in cell wall biosynthesis